MSKLIYYTSTVEDGNTSFRHGEKDTVISNRENILQKIDSKIEDCVFMTVEMRDRILEVSNLQKEMGGHSREDALVCDAMITTQENLTLFLCVADCLPILIHDAVKNVLAIVHGGWPNTDLKIVKKVIEQMKEEHSCEISDLAVVIGPGIQKESLLYDKNIFNLIKSDWVEYIYPDITDSEKYHIDNLGFTIKQLLDLGITEDQITVDKTDTFTDENYFSHVRDYVLNQKDKGRFCTVAKIVSNKTLTTYSPSN